MTYEEIFIVLGQAWK